MKSLKFLKLIIAATLTVSCTKELIYVSANQDEVSVTKNSVTVKVTEAGSLLRVLSAQSVLLANITSLTIEGPINSTDLKFIRELAGADSLGNATQGGLEKIDLSKSTLVQGGSPHFIYEGVQPCTIGEDNTIPSYAFGYCTIKEVILPDNIRKLGSQAFYKCDSLRSINIPASLESISTSVFYGCEQLSSTIIIPEKVTIISNYAFGNCRLIPQIKLHNNIKHIGNYAFYDCRQISDFGSNLPNLESIGEYAFYRTKLSQAILPPTMTSIPAGVFKSCSAIKEVNLSGIKTIGDEAFHGCINLKLSGLPEGIDSIGVSAFQATSFYGNLYLPKSLRYIGANAFSRTDIESLEINSDIQTTISSTTSSAAFYSCDKLKSVKINEGCTILKLSFDYCKALAEVSLPNSLDSIGHAKYPEVFSRCTALSRIDLPDKLRYIGYGSFRGCTSLAEISVPTTVTTISKYAFKDCVSLSSVTLSPNINNIPQGAFDGCTSLTTIVIPDGIQTIESGAFSKSGLRTLQLSNTLRSIGNKAFYECKQLKNVLFPSNLSSIGSEAFHSCTLLASINLPSSLISLGTNAFSNCSALATINVDDGCRLKQIPSSCFYQCTALKNFYIPSFVTTLGDAAFSISGLSTIKIPESVSVIGNNCFAYCNKLETVENMSAIPQQIYSSVFKNVQLSNVKLLVPQKSVERYKSADVWGGFGIIDGI